MCDDRVITVNSEITGDVDSNASGMTIQDTEVSVTVNASIKTDDTII